MNDFTLLNNQKFIVENIEISQIQVKDFAAWCVYAEPVKEFLDKKDYSDDVLPNYLLRTLRKSDRFLRSWQA